MQPLCFVDPAIWRLWSRSSVPSEHACPPCKDCTPTYQHRMKKRGLCEHPETQFSIDNDGGVYGIPA